MKQEEIMSGEILVVGNDSIQIDLRRRGKPDTVLVEFKDSPHHHPCNPHHDKLEWEIHNRHHKLVLVIKWNVQSARTIIWAVSFE